MRGALESCAGCPERRSRHAAWTCVWCRAPRAEAVAPEVWRVLFARRLARAGLPVADAGLDFWELTLLSLIEEENHGPDFDRPEEL